MILDDPAPSQIDLPDARPLADLPDDEALRHAIHEGVLEDPPWRTFLRLLELRLGCRFAVFVHRWPTDADGGFLITPRPDERAQAIFSTSIAAEDPLLSIPNRKAVVLSSLVPSDALRKTNYFRVMLEPFGMIDLLAMNICDPASGLLVRLRCARVEGQPLFSEADRRLVQALEPSLRTSVAIRARFLFDEYERKASDQASDRLSVGSVIINEKRRVLLTNGFARDLLKARGGLCVSGGMLRSTDRNADRLLQTAMGDLLGEQPAPSGRPPQRTVLIRHNGGGEFLSLLIQRIDQNPAVEPDAAAALLVLIKTTGSPVHVVEEFLIDMFALTKREAQVAVRLMQGDSLYEAADALGVARATARVHIRSIFSKTETNRQAQLVGLLLNLAQALWT